MDTVIVIDGCPVNAVVTGSWLDSVVTIDGRSVTAGRLDISFAVKDTSSGNAFVTDDWLVTTAVVRVGWLGTAAVVRDVVMGNRLGIVVIKGGWLRPVLVGKS